MELGFSQPPGGRPAKGWAKVDDRQGTAADGEASKLEFVSSPAREDNVFEGSRDSANKGMFFDAGQIPMTLMEPSMQAGQSVTPEAPLAVSDSATSQSGPGSA
jgi:hypothetical protein